MQLGWGVTVNLITRPMYKKLKEAPKTTRR